MTEKYHIRRDLKIEEGTNLFDEWKIGTHIGSGNSTVYEVKHKNSNESRALKEIVLHNDIAYENVKEEIKILEAIQSNNDLNVIRFHGYCIAKEVVDEFNTTRTAYILMEKGVTNLDKLIKRPSPVQFNQAYPEFKIQELIHDLISVFLYLQKIHIAHCDIKPENIIVMDLDKLYCKICDVGSSRFMSADGHNTTTKTVAGTIPFMAPELHRSQKNSVRHNPFKCDVFSLGLVFLYMLTNKRFSQQERKKIPEDVYEEILEDWISEVESSFPNLKFSKLLRKMLIFDPIERPDFEELVSWINQEKNSELFSLAGEMVNSIIQPAEDENFSPNLSPLKRGSNPLPNSSSVSLSLSGKKPINLAPIRTNMRHHHKEISDFNNNTETMSTEKPIGDLKGTISPKKKNLRFSSISTTNKIDNTLSSDKSANNTNDEFFPPVTPQRNVISNSVINFSKLGSNKVKREQSHSNNTTFYSNSDTPPVTRGDNGSPLHRKTPSQKVFHAGGLYSQSNGSTPNSTPSEVQSTNISPTLRRNHYVLPSKKVSSSGQSVKNYQSNSTKELNTSCVSPSRNQKSSFSSKIPDFDESTGKNKTGGLFSLNKVQVDGGDFFNFHAEIANNGRQYRDSDSTSISPTKTFTRRHHPISTSTTQQGLYSENENQTETSPFECVINPAVPKEPLKNELLRKKHELLDRSIFFNFRSTTHSEKIKKSLPGFEFSIFFRSFSMAFKENLNEESLIEEITQLCSRSRAKTVSLSFFNFKCDASTSNKLNELISSFNEVQLLSITLMKSESMLTEKVFSQTDRLSNLAIINMNLARNQITNKILTPIIVGIVAAPQLTEMNLNLSHNLLTRDIFIVFNQVFSSSKSNKIKSLYLDFSFNQINISEETFDLILPTSLINLCLFLESQEVRGSIDKFCKELEMLTELKVLSLNFSKCSLISKAVLLLCDSLGKLKKLEDLSLNLQDNDLDLESLKKLCCSIGGMLNGKKLDLDLRAVDQVSQTIIRKILDYCRYLKKLSVLNVKIPRLFSKKTITNDIIKILDKPTVKYDFQSFSLNQMNFLIEFENARDSVSCKSLPEVPEESVRNSHLCELLDNGMTKFCNEAYLCITCSVKIKEPCIICSCCATKCHTSHSLYIQSKGFYNCKCLSMGMCSFAENINFCLKELKPSSEADDNNYQICTRCVTCSDGKNCKEVLLCLKCRDHTHNTHEKQEIGYRNFVCRCEESMHKID